MGNGKSSSRSGYCTKVGRQYLLDKRIDRKEENREDRTGKAERSKGHEIISHVLEPNRWMLCSPALQFQHQLRTPRWTTRSFIERLEVRERSCLPEPQIFELRKTPANRYPQRECCHGRDQRHHCRQCDPPFPVRHWVSLERSQNRYDSSKACQREEPAKELK